MVSICVNLDTRPGFLENFSEEGKMFEGTRSIDFLTHGVTNKINFFQEFPHEVILFIDIIDPIPIEMYRYLYESLMNNTTIKTIVFNKHREYFDNMEFCPKWMDMNFLNSLMLAKGEYIAHFDADMVAFKKEPSIIVEWLSALERGDHDYICYPSLHSPRAITDPDFEYIWASTRFFLCKRSSLNFDETIKCLLSDNYLYGKYGEKKRRCPWLEHVLGILSPGNKVFYPPMQNDKVMIFSWNKYQTGIIETLNNTSYAEVKKFVEDRGGINYPCDVRC